jgi:hypothetical protein
MERATLFLTVIGFILIFGTSGVAFAQSTPNLTGYFVEVNDEAAGPFDTAGLMQLVNQRQLNRNTLVWRAGMPEWVAAGTVEELAPLLAAADPPPLQRAQAPPPLPNQALQATTPPTSSQEARVQRERRWYNSFAPGLENNRVFINAGVGLGPISYLYNWGIPPISASVGFKLSNTVPITLGIIGVFSTWEYFMSDVLDVTFMNIGVGARVMYHFNFARNFDSYIGLNFGYVFQSLHGEIWGVTRPVSASYFLYGGIFGVRYFFTNNFGVYAEVGYSSVQFLSAGLSLKF